MPKIRPVGKGKSFEERTKKKEKNDEENWHEINEEIKRGINHLEKAFDKCDEIENDKWGTENLKDVLKKVFSLLG